MLRIWLRQSVRLGYRKSQFPVNSIQRQLTQSASANDYFYRDIVSEVLKAQTNQHGALIVHEPGKGDFAKRFLDEGIQNLTCMYDVRKQDEKYLELMELLEDHKDLTAFRVPKSLIWKASAEILDLIPYKNWEDEPAATIVYSMIDRRNLKSSFFRFLISILTLTDGIYSNGRVEWMVALPDVLYQLLLSSEKEGRHLSHFRPASTLVSLFYNITFLKKVEMPTNAVLIKKGRASKLLHPNEFMLTKFVPKVNLYDDLLPREEIQNFLEFTKILLKAKQKVRVIPKLEPIVPTCGLHLIEHGFTMTDTVATLTPDQILLLYKILLPLTDFQGLFNRARPNIHADDSHDSYLESEDLHGEEAHNEETSDEEH